MSPLMSLAIIVVLTGCDVPRYNRHGYTLQTEDPC